MVKRESYTASNAANKRRRQAKQAKQAKTTAPGAPVTRKTKTKRKRTPPRKLNEQPAAVWLHHTELVAWVHNDKIRANDTKVEAMMTRLKTAGFWQPMTAWRDAPAATYDDGQVQPAGHRVCSGHLRLKAVARIVSENKHYTFEGAPGPGFVPVRLGKFDSELRFEEQALAANFNLGAWRAEGRDAALSRLHEGGIDVRGIGVDEDIMAQLTAGAVEVTLPGSVSAGDDDDPDDFGETSSSKDPAPPRNTDDGGNDGDQGRGDTSLLCQSCRSIVDGWARASRNE